MTERRVLGIKAGQTWAYHRGRNHPLIPVRIIDPGTHYNDRIIIEPEYAWGRRWRENVTRVKLPCEWARVDEYVREYAHKRLEIHRGPLDEPEPKREPEPIDPTQVHILATVNNVDFERPIAYNMTAAAAATGYSTTTIRDAMAKGLLRARYANSRPVFLYDDLWRWIDELPPYSLGHEPRDYRPEPTAADIRRRRAREEREATKPKLIQTMLSDKKD